MIHGLNLRTQRSFWEKINLKQRRSLVTNFLTFSKPRPMIIMGWIGLDCAGISLSLSSNWYHDFGSVGRLGWAQFSSIFQVISWFGRLGWSDNAGGATSPRACNHALAAKFQHDAEEEEEQEEEEEEEEEEEHDDYDDGGHDEDDDKCADNRETEYSNDPTEILKQWIE